MKTKKVIELLQKADPSGEEDVCIENVDIFTIHSEPAYWDGSLQILDRDESSEYYNVIGARYKRSGTKIVISSLSISDAICNDTNLPVDYSELDEQRATSAKKAHDQLRIWYTEMEQGLERDSFVKWAKSHAEKLTEDSREDFGHQARAFFEDQGLKRSDPVKITTGNSYVSARESQWDSMFGVVIENGFLKIEEK